MEETPPRTFYADSAQWNEFPLILLEGRKLCWSFLFPLASLFPLRSEVIRIRPLRPDLVLTGEAVQCTLPSLSLFLSVRRQVSIPWPLSFEHHPFLPPSRFRSGRHATAEESASPAARQAPRRSPNEYIFRTVRTLMPSRQIHGNSTCPKRSTTF